LFNSSNRNWMMKVIIMWGQHLQGVSYFLDIIAFCNKCVMISTCQSCEKAANFGKGSSYKIFNNAIQILLNKHTSLIEIFCSVLDVKNFVFNNDYNTKDGIGVSNLTCKDVFRFSSLFITCTFMTRSQVTGWNPLEGFTKSSCGKLRLGGTFPTSNSKKG